MTLSPQLAEVRLGKLDTKTSSKLVVPGTLSRLENFVMSATGRFDRRAGTSLLTTQAGVRNIHDHGNELLLGTADTLYSRFASANNARGTLTSFDTRHSPVNNTSFAQLGHDMVITNGQEWSVWVDGRGGIRYAVRDVATGAYVVSEGVISTDADMRCPRVFAVGTSVLITYVETNDTNPVDLLARKIAVASPTVIGVETGIANSLMPAASNAKDTFAGMDGAVVSSTDIVFVYVVANGGSTSDERVRLHRWDVSAMTTVTSLTESADAGDGKGGVAIIKSTSGFWVVHSQGTPSNQVRLLIAASDLSSFTTTATILSYGGSVRPRAVTGWVDGSSTAHVLAESRDASTTALPNIIYLTRTSGGSVAQVANYHGFGLASQTFVSGSTRYVLACAQRESVSDSDNVTLPILPASYFVMAAQTGTLAGRALSQIAAINGDLNDGTGRTLPAVQSTSTGFAVAGGLGVASTRYGAAVVYFDPSSRVRWLEAAGCTTIPGSWPRIYDGLGVTELGFEFSPNISVSTTGASGLPDGTYHYRATWAWVDAISRLHESAPCAAVPITITGGPKSVVIPAATLTATMKKAPSQQAILRVWRTPEGDGEDADYFLVGSVANDTSTSLIQLTDALADADLVRGERLYTLGETVLANTATSPCAAMAPWGNRLWSTDGAFLVYSKLIRDAFGVAHSDEQFIEANDQYGDFVAVADGGQRLLAFKRGAIYAQTGAGPGDTGAGEFPQLDRLELPLGARSQVSVISTEIGVFFQDDATGQIWLLGGEGAEYVGADIEGLMSGLTIVDAVQVGRLVRFYTSAGTTLVYDLHHRMWTPFTGQAAAAAGVVNGVAHYATSGGAVRYDDPAVFTEAGTTYQALLETGWISLAGLGGYQRVYQTIALGDALAAHTLSMVATYRFGNTTQTKSKASSALTAASGYRVEARPGLAYQCSTAIKIRLSDDSPATAGAGIEALLLSVGLDRKATRLPAAHTAT